ncbi:hypothetical protein JAAARDRAFT_412861 [Jaapia argillacea MUCL 33604]|uniref:Uncharacterized protein n=1 Tax=Jaapia argillacea MUCL 33604 TaxID=933084 RepID=A0A067PGT8_9AGAM|nr:hypothetical protein JAAARDRAFT_412861 [Jaapia argillacea MUCL 33604]
MPNRRTEGEVPNPLSIPSNKHLPFSTAATSTRPPSSPSSLPLPAPPPSPSTLSLRRLNTNLTTRTVSSPSTPRIPSGSSQTPHGTRTVSSMAQARQRLIRRLHLPELEMQLSIRYWRIPYLAVVEGTNERFVEEALWIRRRCASAQWEAHGPYGSSWVQTPRLLMRKRTMTNP